MNVIIEEDLYDKEYIKKYSVTNLWKYDIAFAIKWSHC